MFFLNRLVSVQQYSGKSLPFTLVSPEVELSGCVLNQWGRTQDIQQNFFFVCKDNIRAFQFNEKERRWKRASLFFVLEGSVTADQCKVQ